MMLENKNNKKYRILFTIPNFDTAGGGKALLNICKNLDKKYFEPYISCSHSRGHLFEEIIKLGIPFVINKTGQSTFSSFKIFIVQFIPWVLVPIIIKLIEFLSILEISFS